MCLCCCVVMDGCCCVSTVPDIRELHPHLLFDEGMSCNSPDECDLAASIRPEHAEIVCW